MALNKEIPDFRFAHAGAYDVSAIADVVRRFKDEWYLDTSRQDNYSAHEETNSFFLNRVLIAWRLGEPLQLHYKSDNKDIWSLVEPIVKELEQKVDGVRGHVLFINLPAGKSVKPHEDAGQYFLSVARFHVPIITNPDVSFVVGGEDKFLEVGQCWEINNNKTHSVENRGAEDRIHLLIDVMPKKHMEKTA